MTQRYPFRESATLELKQALPQSDQIIKTLIGFCNLHGGKLVIGVADDRSIEGLDQKELEHCLQWIEKAVYEASFPPIIPRVSTQCIGNKNVLEIEVSAGMNKPYYRRSEGLEKGTYIRLGRNTVRATPEMIEELRWQTSSIHFESLPVYQATIEELDQEKITAFLKERKNHGTTNISSKMLQAYGITVSEHAHEYPTTAGILTFGRDPQYFFSEAMIICTHFHGTEGREVIATIDCKGTLFEQFLSAYDFLITRLTRRFQFEGPQRQEILEVPQEAIREVLLNAIVHRNYHLPAPTKIALWADRIEIFTPGGFPGPIDTENLRAGRTYLRNQNICRIFREAGYIEKLGSGFIVMLDSYQAAKLPPPKVIDGGDFVKCVLPRSTAETIQVGNVEENILALFDDETQLQVKEITKLLGISRSSAARALKKLTERSLLEKRGRTRSVHYRKTRKNAEPLD